MSRAQFMAAGRDELYELYKLLTFRELNTMDIEYVEAWTEEDVWTASMDDLLSWLRKMPEREIPLNETLQVVVVSERRGSS